MPKWLIGVLSILISAAVFGLVYFTRDTSIAERDIPFEFLALGVLAAASLFTVLGIRYNLKK